MSDTIADTPRETSEAPDHSAKEEEAAQRRQTQGDDDRSSDAASEGDDDGIGSQPTAARRQPNLGDVSVQMPEFFAQLEAGWVAEFKRRMAVPVSEYDQHSRLGKINWDQFALVESEEKICRGHHAMCPQIRCRRSGQLYRCKIVSAKRIHFNLTTLGFREDEYEREIRNSLQERRFLFSFDHPFVRSGLGYFCDANYNVGAFLEEFPHGTLLDYFRKNDEKKIVCSFTEEQVKYFTAQVLLGLEYLHCVGCVHRDVQAGNLLVDSRGYLKLTDFAITAQMPPGDKLTDVTCFRYYAAPEYFSGNGYGFPVDFYALGLMLYEMLTHECFSDQEDVFDCDGSVDWGIMPEDLAALLRQKAESGSDTPEVPDISEVNADLPSTPARGFVDDCLIYDPDYRPDRDTARFYPWFNGVDFEQLYAKRLELPWRPEKVVSYQADVDEEYPLSLVLDSEPLPESFRQHAQLF